MTFDESQSPNSLPWPPIILATCVAASLGLGLVAPLPAATNAWVRAAGYAAMSIGIALDLWAIVTMGRARTNILPHRGAGRLVTTGPFRFTRNPIYVANVTLMTGVGFGLGNSWFIVLGIASAFAVDRLAVRREERHLAARFGQDWTGYASRVPRWLI